MPELPDIAVYIDCLRSRIVDRVLRDVRIGHPFLLRSVDPPIAAVKGKPVVGIERLGKRIVIGVADDLFLVLHLMIAGRLRWRATGAVLVRKFGLAAFDFDNGSLVLTEAGSKRRASLFVVKGRAGLEAHDPGGIEVLDADLAAFTAALKTENHTLKRALTDPHLFSGIGNAYSDEILHAAQLSPVALTQRLDDVQIARLHAATQTTLKAWTERLGAAVGDGFPDKVTAFHDGMAVHGRYRKPCPACGAPVQRIRYAENEANYCARCQTGGKLLADRALSKLLKSNWPRTLDELEERRPRQRPSPRPSPRKKRGEGGTREAGG